MAYIRDILKWVRKFNRDRECGDRECDVTKKENNDKPTAKCNTKRTAKVVAWLSRNRTQNGALIVRKLYTDWQEV